MAGRCDSRFTAVEDAFEENIAAGLEAGAACAVVIDGDLVIDLWGGHADPTTALSWERDTLVDCRSATKGLTALCLALLVDRGVVDLDHQVRRYWPEFRVEATVRQAFSHQAGIPIVDDLKPGAILAWDVMANAIARQEPMWHPGERHGYHGVSFGWLVGEPVRRITGETLPGVLKREVFERLDVDGFMGTPVEHQPRMATLVWGRPAHGAHAAAPTGPTGSDPTLAQKMYAPVLPPLAPPMNDAGFRAAAIPVTGAAVTARTLAAIYGELAEDGGVLVSADTTRAMGDVQVDGDDAILGVSVSRSLGYERTPSWTNDGRPSYCWGSPGGGGVVTFVDPVARIGYAYVNNASWAGSPGQDPRSGRITTALYACL